MADIEHRRHPAGAEPPDWDEFFRRCVDDVPITHVAAEFHALGAGPDIEIWSGRWAVVREETRRWLRDHLGVEVSVVGHDPPPDAGRVRLRLRGEHDRTSDHVLKERWLDRLRAAGGRVDFVFEDRAGVVAMWRARHPLLPGRRRRLLRAGAAAPASRRRTGGPRHRGILVSSASRRHHRSAWRGFGSDTRCRRGSPARRLAQKRQKR